MLQESMNVQRKIGDQEVSITDSGFSVEGDGLKFVYTHSIPTFPIARVGVLAHKPEGYKLSEGFSSEMGEVGDTLRYEGDRVKYSSLLNKQGFGKEGNKNLIERLLGEKIGWPELAEILGKSSNSHLIIDGGENPDVRINCNYKPGANTLTATSVLPTIGNGLDMINCFAPKNVRIYLAQMACNRAVDDLGLSNAYEVFDLKRKKALGSISGVLFEYLNSR